MFGREGSEVVYFTIDYDPAVVWSCVFVDLGDWDLGVRHFGLMLLSRVEGRGRLRLAVITIPST